MGIREISKGYSMDYDKFGITGQHVYWEGVNVDSDGTQAVPVVGDIFIDAAGTPFPTMFCIHVSQSVVSDDSRVIQYTCSYSNEPIDNHNMFLSNANNPPTPINELPQDFDLSGEYVLFKVSDKFFNQSNWVWDGTTTKIANAIPFRVRTYNRKFSRIVPSANYAAFLKDVRYKIGKVNDVVWEDGGTGCWLFLGGRSELFRDQQNQRAYKFDLNFAYRDPDDTNVDGWNKILDEVGQWKMPMNTSTNTYLYSGTTFDSLFQ